MESGKSKAQTVVFYGRKTFKQGLAGGHRRSFDRYFADLGDGRTQKIKL
jgi:hypothetical protein